MLAQTGQNASAFVLLQRLVVLRLLRVDFALSWYKLTRINFTLLFVGVDRVQEVREGSNALLGTESAASFLISRRYLLDVAGVIADRDGPRREHVQLRLLTILWHWLHQVAV